MDRLGSLFWSGLTALALVAMLTTIAGPAAFAGPIVQITEPAHGQVVQGHILINVAYRTDSNLPIVRLELMIDDQLARQYQLPVPRLEGAQGFNWDFSTAAGSTHSISARAIDQAGQVGQATITVTVTGAGSGPGGQDRVPPVINIYYPAQGAELSGEVEIKAEASDNVGVKYVFFFIDGKLHKMIMNAPPFVDSWDTTRVADGAHVLQAKAMDEAENSAASAEVTVFVRNHDMTGAAAGMVAPPGATPPSAIPTVGTGEPTIATGAFGTAEDEQPTLMAAASTEEVRAARVGYVAAINDNVAAARTSLPRMLAGLPQPTLRPTDVTAEETVAAYAAVGSAETEAVGPQVAATEFMARTTPPRLLPAETVHVVTPLPEGVPVSAPFGPQLVSAEFDQRITMPRAEIAGPTGGATDVATAEGWAVLEPTLQVVPDPERVARNTAPRTLTPAEVLDLEAAPLAEAVVAAPQTACAARDDLTGATRIAVLPERATQVAIPADGRMTRPGGAMIAPVAAMSFEDVQVLFNHRTLELLTGPENRNGISIAPLREIFEASDGVLYWYPVEKRVRAVRPGTDMQLTIGNPEVQINDQTRTLEVAPYIKQGRTMVPLQFLADTLNVTVTFNPASGQICLTSNDF